MELPYRAEIKSDKLVMRCCAHTRIMRTQSMAAKGIMNVGPKYTGKKPTPVRAALPIEPK
jgi:hypothetical protein